MVTSLLIKVIILGLLLGCRGSYEVKQGPNSKETSNFWLCLLSIPHRSKPCFFFYFIFVLTLYRYYSYGVKCMQATSSPTYTSDKKSKFSNVQTNFEPFTNHVPLEPPNRMRNHIRVEKKYSHHIWQCQISNIGWC